MYVSYTPYQTDISAASRQSGYLENAGKIPLPWLSWLRQRIRYGVIGLTPCPVPYLFTIMQISFIGKPAGERFVHHCQDTRKTHRTITRLISTLHHAATTTDYAYINYYRSTYGNIPLWVLVNVLTFGNLSKMYQVFPQSLQSKVCKDKKDIP